MSLGLPPVSTGLKTVAPYLQRAEELVAREPVIAYWCAYYAAQVGISLKAHDTGSHNMLLNLLSALERLKKEIGRNDAIDNELASAAYVENFALKIFKMADDEDMAGKASKSTAKKFLAAANFFEVLRVFPTNEVSESTEGKLKYAKWKAADIAKAFREGRKPMPGPAGSQLDPELTSTTTPLPPSDPSTSQTQPKPSTPPRSSPQETFSEITTPLSRSPKRRSPPPSFSPADVTRANRLPIHPGEGKHDDEALSPGRWSTTATPGFDPARTSGLDDHIVDPFTMAKATTGGSKLRTAWVSSEMEGAGSDEEPARDSSAVFASTRAHHPNRCFTPYTNFNSLLPFFPTRSSPPRSSPPRSSPPRSRKHSPSIALSDLPPGFVPTGLSTRIPESDSMIFPSSNASPPSAPPFVLPPPPTSSRPAIPPPSLQAFAPPFPPPSPSPPVPTTTRSVSAIASSPAFEPIRPTAHPSPPTAVELTPSLIAKAQRHCRFAISSLDYEDAEHAIRELRTALEILGG
ncbi:Vta1 like-domain-containing protein [Melanogaster broomeanus]|nr:Vta1 like-domain-containing protein [Melanogaster broomeanus]